MNCKCGKIARLWSALLEQSFCSDECYEAARGTQDDNMHTQYAGHGKYKEDHHD